jgi:hypothetical protein
MKMQTPLPVQLETWIKNVQNKKAPYDIRQTSMTHLIVIRDLLDKVIRSNQSRPEKGNKSKYENMSTR